MTTITHDGANIEIVHITSALAESWIDGLTVNPDDLPVNLSRINRIAGDMRSGRWQFRGDTIVISRGGELRNGRHRLHAIVRAGVTVPMLVVCNVEDRTQ